MVEGEPVEGDHKQLGDSVVKDGKWEERTIDCITLLVHIPKIRINQW
jgi:hypothetical protein